MQIMILIDYPATLTCTPIDKHMSPHTSAYSYSEFSFYWALVEEALDYYRWIYIYK